MKYCWNCQRINPGEPIFCGYCGRTFGERICSRCRHANPKENLVCQNCGNSELSEISSAPSWFKSLKLSFRLAVLLTIIFVVSHIVLFLPLFIILGLLLVGYSLLPEALKKILSAVFSFIKLRVTGTKEKK